MSRKKLKIKHRHKRMKTLEECAGLTRSYKVKPVHSHVDFDNFRNYVYSRDWTVRSPRKFERPDGTVSVDKTSGGHSRPISKQTIRNANRRAVKRARQRLKRQMLEEVS